MFLEISQNSQECIYARVSFLIKCLWHRCFLVNFAKFLRTPCFTEHFRWLLLPVCASYLRPKYNTILYIIYTILLILNCWQIIPVFLIEKKSLSFTRICASIPIKSKSSLQIIKIFLWSKHFSSFPSLPSTVANAYGLTSILK